MPERFVERRTGRRVRVPALTVLWHPQVSRVGHRVLLPEIADGKTVEVSGLAPGFRAPGQTAAETLGQRAAGGRPLVLRPGSAPGAVAVAAGGAAGRGVRLDGGSLPGEVELPPAAVDAGVVLELGRKVVLLLHSLAAEPLWEPEELGLVGDSEEICQVRREIRRVADLDVPVLLRGETGTGKELIAHAIHAASRRRDRRCLSVNMGAIPPSLAAAELFGAARGAFTGAVRPQAGYFARAHRGTLFLDEVGEAMSEVQVMLLRVLETGEIQPLGDQEPQRVDVRLIAATDSRLEQAAEEGSFRAPLLHRLAGYEILVPPLAERRDDFGRLLVHFLRQELESVGEPERLDDPAWLPASIVARLARHRWPGNVRQLKNVARQLVIASRGAERVRINPQLDRLLREAGTGGGLSRRGSTDRRRAGDRRRDERDAAADRPSPASAAPPSPRYRDPAEVGDEELLTALRENRWAVKPTAEALGVSRTSLYALIERCPRVRKASELGMGEITRVLSSCDGDPGVAAERLEVSAAGLRQRMRELDLS